MIGASDDDETPAVPNGGNAARILAADRSAVDRRRIEKREVAIEAHEEDPIPFEPRNEMNIAGRCERGTDTRIYRERRSFQPSSCFRQSPDVKRMCRIELAPRDDCFVRRLDRGDAILIGAAEGDNAVSMRSFDGRESVVVSQNERAHRA